MKLGPYELGPNDTPENGIYCGDARELSRAIPDESVIDTLAPSVDNSGKVFIISYIKNDTVPENCITLCRSCHSVTNSNRKYWQEQLDCLIAARFHKVS